MSENKDRLAKGKLLEIFERGDIYVNHQAYNQIKEIVKWFFDEGVQQIVGDLKKTEDMEIMMCPNCGAIGSNIGFEIKMNDTQFWNCKTCGFEWMVRKAKNITKYKIRKEERKKE